MKALILYIVFVIVGASIAIGIGYVLEREISATVSLIAFLTMFFANLFFSWLAVIYVMDGSFGDAQGRQAQLEIEKSGRAALNARGATD